MKRNDSGRSAHSAPSDSVKPRYSSRLTSLSDSCQTSTQSSTSSRKAEPARQAPMNVCDISDIDLPSLYCWSDPLTRVCVEDTHVASSTVVALDMAVQRVP